MASMANAPRRWFRVRLRTLVVLILLVTIGLSVYSYWSDYSERSRRLERELLSPNRGDFCTVVLKRDQVSVERASPTAGNVNGVDNDVSGRFVLMNNEWIVLAGNNDGDPQQWIPRENIRLLRVEAE